MKVNKSIAIQGLKKEIKVLEKRLAILPQEEKVNTETELGFQLMVRIKCVKSNLNVLRGQLRMMEEA